MIYHNQNWLLLSYAILPLRIKNLEVVPIPGILLGLLFRITGKRSATFEQTWCFFFYNGLMLMCVNQQGRRNTPLPAGSQSHTATCETVVLAALQYHTAHSEQVPE